MDRISCRVQGIEAVLAEQGAGDPALFIHGWGGGSSNWRRVWRELSVRYRCLAPDLPGWGDSEKPSAPYSIEWYADWLAELLEVRGASPAFVAGHSMGGTIALVLALRHPARVKKLALLNPVVRGSDGVKLETRFLTLPVVRQLAYPFTRSRTFLRFLARNFTAAKDGIEETDLELIARGTYVSMTRSIDALKRVDLSGFLPTVAAPTLVIASDDDREIPPAQSTLAASIPGARLETLRGAGHVSLLERPDDVARMLGEHFGAGSRRERPPQW